MDDKKKVEFGIYGYNEVQRSWFPTQTWLLNNQNIACKPVP